MGHVSKLPSGKDAKQDIFIYNTGVVVFPDISHPNKANQDAEKQTDRMMSTVKNRSYARVEKFWCFWLLVSLSAWPSMKEEQGGSASASQARLWQTNGQGREKASNMTESRHKVKWAQTLSTHKRTDCANPVPVNCSVLESLGRHQRVWAPSCSELQIPSWLNVDAWTSRLDQLLIHSPGPGNYWVSSEPVQLVATCNLNHGHTHEVGHACKEAWHACRLCHDNITLYVNTRTEQYVWKQLMPLNCFSFPQCQLPHCNICRIKLTEHPSSVLWIVLHYKIYYEQWYPCAKQEFTILHNKTAPVRVFQCPY